MMMVDLFLPVTFADTKLNLRRQASRSIKRNDGTPTDSWRGRTWRTNVEVRKEGGEGTTIAVLKGRKRGGREGKKN